MPIVDSPYTDADMIIGLYQDPANEVLLAEYLLRTGGVQLGFQPAGAGALGGDSGLGDPGVTGTGGGPCFTAETRVQMANGAVYDFAFLYENRERFIGQLAKSFDDENRLAEGKITNVFRSTIFEILVAYFEGERVPMKMNPLHRFWTIDNEFVSMKHIGTGKEVWSHGLEWKTARVVKKEIIPVPEGVYVYNMTIDHYRRYFAFSKCGMPKAVSNAKPREPIEG